MDELRYRYFVTALIAVALIAAGCFALTLWTPKDSSEVATWVQAVGSVGAIACAIWIALRQQKENSIRDSEAEAKRRQYPLLTLRTIIDRASFLIGRIPDDGPSTIHVEHYFRYEASIDSITNALQALRSFPIERLVDYMAIQSIFEMQDALHTSLIAVEQVLSDPKKWNVAWESEKPRIATAKTRAELAIAQLQGALDGAGVSY